jgi:glycosyltransferase involved in cell wall biosynthesis
LKVAMALYGDLSFDSRVLREAQTLADAGHSVTVYCLTGSAPAGAGFSVVARVPSVSSALPDGTGPFHASTPGTRLGRLTARARWMVGYVRNLRSWGDWAVRSASGADVWHAHDLPGLMAIGPHVGGHQRLVYDSHEIFLDAGIALGMPWPVRRLLHRYERHLAQRADALVTVNEGYLDVLETRLRPRRTVIVRNCPPRWDPPEQSRSPLREATGVDASTAVVLYHGILGSSRGVEHMAQAILRDGLETTHAAALGFGDRDQLDAWASDPRFGGRFHVLDAVAPNHLLEWVAGADVDVIALQRTTLNHYLCTPNKLWESLAAGVPVVVSDFPVMRSIVMDDPDGPLGAVCDPSDVASVAAAIRSIIARSPADRARLRERCLRAAHARWNWEKESARLLDLYEGL